MTSKPTMSERSLGPILAAAGGVVVLAAVIAGFIAVGGPGDARDRRLDGLTIGRIQDVLQIARCAFNGNGVAPASIEEARQARGWQSEGQPTVPCDLGTRPDEIPVSIGSKPAKPGDVTYERASNSIARVCGNFRKPSTSSRDACNGNCMRGMPYDAIYVDRPVAGVHCFDVELAVASKQPN